MAGDIKFGNVDHLDEEGLRMNVVNASAYYVFNHRKFSYPAALYQNYYQLRSAGSWLAGLSVQAGGKVSSPLLSCCQHIIWKAPAMVQNTGYMAKESQ